MLFIVPDADATGTQKKPDGDGQEQTSPASDASEKSQEGQDKNIKVELDLDDAPFLDDDLPPEEEPEDTPAEPEDAAQDEADQAAPEPKKNIFKRIIGFLFGSKKRIIIFAAVLVLLIGGGVGAMLFLSPSETPPAEPTPEVHSSEGPQPIIRVLNSTKHNATTVEGDKFLLVFDPFTVPAAGSEGEIRFLECQFSVPAVDEDQMNELKFRNLEIRDAVYYYFSNKDIALLSTEAASEALRADLVSVINEHLSYKKIETVRIMNYVVTP